MTAPTQTSGAAPAPSTSLREHWLVLTAMMLALVTVMMDNSILNVALPTIGRDLHASSGDLQWIVAAYSVTFGGLLMSTGNLSDRIGRRTVMLIGLTTMALASFAVLLAHSVWMVIAVRLLVGVGAAFVMPSTLSLLFTTFTGEARGKVMGIFGIAAMAGFTVGPVLGGFLLGHLAWEWLFLLNVPVALICIPVLLRAVPESTDGTAEPADIPGTITSVLTVGALIYGLTSGPEFGWLSTRTLGSFAAAVAFGALFGWRQLTAQHPMLDLRMVANRRFATPALVESIVFFIMMATMFVNTQVLQLIFGYSALHAGLLSLPTVAVMVLSNGIVARASTVFGDRWATVLGLGLSAVGVTVVLSGIHHVALILGGMAVMSIGNRMAMTTAAILVIDALPKERAGMGSALNDTFQEVGGALGIGVLGAVLSQAFQGGLPSWMPAGARTSIVDAVASGRPAVIDAARTAWVHGAQLTLGIAAVLLVACAVIAAFTFPSGHTTKDAAAPDESGERKDAELTAV
ncbi:MFS transporter [Calidifontibacter sp. DB0510]|uniref:MFS transporter n=1 Tax=Metallococcus carri TaxID=1656884 RepID=A0A967EA32_9MICO|nr:MFS transporter [Metallococcus carri]NHN55459.1 MFS transporter [Metallococcus carri]NOP38357.1 MFS transporter [Calidifontibacter sp. DB2511S]